jgi:DNA repair protein RecN (Recombination protein N)
MLKSLSIENIALVDKAELAFDKGLTVLSGETGAGKSIVVTALSLALGERAEREFIRHGADKAIVSAEFAVSTMPPIYRKQFAEFIAENRINILREIARDGSSKVRINGAISTVARLKEITAPLAEILGQHANQQLMDEENHLLFLDHFGSLNSLRDSVSERFLEWERSSSDLRKVTARRDQLKSQRELLVYQKNEIEKGQIRIGEEEELVHERKILDSARSLTASAALICNILDGDENAVMVQVRAARKELDKMAAVDTSLDPRAAEFTDIDYRLEELRRAVEQYGGSVPDDPARLEEINARLDEIYQLKRKFGGSEGSILETLGAINEQLRGLPDVDAHIAALEREVEQFRKDYTKHALELTALRLKAADYLKKLVVKELAELAIDGAGFEAEFIYEETPDGVILDDRAVRPFDTGLERCRFLFSANKGEPLKSLVKTASGGEISRVLLALKAAEKKQSGLQRSLLVFDEVDVGIGGRTATEVARKLKKLSESSQVFVVTHLHQIARLADHHLVAEKTSRRGGRTVIDVRELQQPEIKRELDRMVALPEK